MIEVTPNKVYTLIHKYAHALFTEGEKINPINMVSMPGVGKSSMIAQIADEYDAEMIDLRLSSQDQTTLTGMPYVHDGEMMFSTPEWFPEDPEKNYILFFDEITNAAPSVQQAAYRLILDRQIDNGKKLPSKVMIISAGNNRTDNSGAKDMLSALGNRFGMHLNVKPDKDSFIEYAMKHKFDETIIGFLEWKGGTYLHKMPEKKSEISYPTPRTWEYVNDHIKTIGKEDESLLETVIAGCIGEVAATDYMAFVKYRHKLPNMTKIASGEETYTVDNTDIGVVFALTSSLVSNANYYFENENATGNIIKLVEQIPPENQAMFVRLLAKTWETGVSKIMASPYRVFLSHIVDAQE